MQRPWGERMTHARWEAGVPGAKGERKRVGGYLRGDGGRMCRTLWARVKTSAFTLSEMGVMEGFGAEEGQEEDGECQRSKGPGQVGHCHT